MLVPFEVLVLLKERQDKHLKLNWQFSIDAARSKLNTYFRRTNPSNSKPHNLIYEVPIYF
jgi:hypothetical protein